MNEYRLKECGIDYDRGIIYFGNDKELYERYLLKFIDQDYLEEAINYLKVGDVENAFASIHKLKSLVDYIRITQGEEMIHMVTESLRAGKSEGVMDGLMFLKLVYDDLKEELRKES